MDIFLVLLFFSLTITLLTCIYFLWYYKKLAKYANADFKVNLDYSYLPLISVIIPTYNEAATIEDKIKNTLGLNYPPEKIEIIVIDSASTDGTPDKVKSNERVKLIKQAERLGKSAALAEVFKIINGEIVVITDADALLDRDVLVKSLPYLADSKVGAVTGKQILVNPNEAIYQKSEQSYRDLFDMIRSAESRLGSTMVFNGPFMAFKREALEAPQQNSVADDTEMAIRVIKKGYRALYVADALYYENIPQSGKSRLKQKERRAQGLIQSFWWHRDILFNKKYGNFGTLIFPAEFAVHFVLPFALFLSVITIAVSLYIDFISTLILAGVYFSLISIYAIAVFLFIGKSMNTQLETEKKINPRKIIITFLSFLQLEFALFSGGVKLMMFGTAHKWEQISDARSKIEVKVDRK
ncbi:MAG: glycosyltransferase [Candidatus Methanoperedens sp.]|nr:glycosyltransferase [Candidatus Methanoperedens sp.]